MSRCARRAFTLVELLVVIAIIGLLIALLGAGIGSVFFAAQQSRCSANLYYLGQALAARRSDELQNRWRRMRVTQWPTRLLPYLEYRADVLICPAGGRQEAIAEHLDPEEVAAFDLSDWGVDPEALDEQAIADDPRPGQEIDELVVVRTVCGKGTFYTEMRAGPNCLKLSEEQYQSARAQGLLGDADSANYIRTKFDCTYRPGSDRNVYWLCFEDYGGDDDFKDVMIRVTDNQDGTYDLYIRAGSTGHTNAVLRKPDFSVLVSVPSRSEGLVAVVGEQEDQQEEGGDSSVWAGGTATGGGDPAEGEGGIGVALTSYGMNAQSPYPIAAGGKIVLMDYCKYLAHAADVWSDARVDPSQDGVPIFARHQGRINVLFSDSSVRAMDPDELNPASPAVQMKYWDP